MAAANSEAFSARLCSTVESSLIELIAILNNPDLSTTHLEFFLERMPPKRKERKGPSAAAKAQGTPPVSGSQSVAIEDVNKAILATITTFHRLSVEWSHIVVPPTCRGLGTYVRIPAGSEILRIDGPIAHALEMFSTASACDNCLTAEADHLSLVSSSEPVELKACVGCGVVKFCSEVRRQAESYHQRVRTNWRTGVPKDRIRCLPQIRMHDA